MIPVFSKLDGNDKNLTPEKIADHINRLQDELAMCFTNISSDNIDELSLDETKMASRGGSYLTGDMIKLQSPAGESFFAGVNKETGKFELFLKNADGEYLMLYTGGVLTINN